ncbi:hypothetical protein PanWU01x14_111280 [Parasponia andersonii]|uniref:Uncharacterized protein n=1 Tax=Parasponia andersonii TaxID=3476 RepID=A0A2P5CYZ8_PARAD|nr:hypothetical protein PanWU01x14_111280 [Parasponia andersonii]
MGKTYLVFLHPSFEVGLLWRTLHDQLPTASSLMSFGRPYPHYFALQSFWMAL